MSKKFHVIHLDLLCRGQFIYVLDINSFMMFHVEHLLLRYVYDYAMHLFDQSLYYL